MDVVFGAVDIAGGIYCGAPLFEVNAFCRDSLGDSLSECGNSLCDHAELCFYPVCLEEEERLI